MKRHDNEPKRSPYGWEMAFSWCPPEDSPLLDGTPSAPEPALGPDPADEQGEVTRRYDRMAWLYDIYDAPMEWLGTRRRRGRLLANAEGRVLEVGVGTGKNLSHYPDAIDLTGIDISEAMLARARRRAGRLGKTADFEVADIHSLPFPTATFDTAVATCVFCSVADPVLGLSELARVTKADGRILLLEHVRPRNRLFGWLADAATVLTRRIFGFRANRRTEANVAAAGLQVVDIRREGVWREMVTTPASGSEGARTEEQVERQNDSPDD